MAGSGRTPRMLQQVARKPTPNSLTKIFKGTAADQGLSGPRVVTPPLLPRAVFVCHQGAPEVGSVSPETPEVTASSVC